MKSLITAFMLIAAFAMPGCQSKGAVDSNGMPKTLVIGMVETEKIPQIKDAREKIRLYLQQKLGMPVEMIYTNDYVGVIEALRANKVTWPNCRPLLM